MGGTPQTVGLSGKIPLKWMIQGYPHFRKPLNESATLGYLILGHTLLVHPNTCKSPASTMVPSGGFAGGPEQQ